MWGWLSDLPNTLGVLHFFFFFWFGLLKYVSFKEFSSRVGKLSKMCEHIKKAKGLHEKKAVLLFHFVLTTAL